MSRPNHRYEGWKASPPNIPSDMTDTRKTGNFTMPGGNVNLVAQWTRLWTYSVNPNNGFPTTVVGQYAHMEIITIPPAPTNPNVNLTFGGWIRSDNGVTIPIGSAQMPNNDLTITAKWDEAPKCNFIRNYNGGTPTNGNGTATGEYYLPHTLQTDTIAPVPPANHSFTHWQVIVNGSNTITLNPGGTMAAVSGTVEFRAIYAPVEVPRVFTVTPSSYNLNPAGETIQIGIVSTINSVNSAWVIHGASWSGGSNWLTIKGLANLLNVNGSGSETVNLVAQANATGGTRTATITFRQTAAPHIDRVLIVTQAPINFGLDISNESASWFPPESLPAATRLIATVNSSAGGSSARIKVEMVEVCKRIPPHNDASAPDGWGSDAYGMTNITSGWIPIPSGDYKNGGSPPDPTYMMSLTNSNLTSSDSHGSHGIISGNQATMRFGLYSNYGNHQLRYEFRVSNGIVSNNQWIPSGISRTFYLYQHGNMSLTWAQFNKSGGNFTVRGTFDNRRILKGGIQGIPVPANFDIDEGYSDNIVVEPSLTMNTGGGASWSSRFRMLSASDIIYGNLPPGMTKLHWRITCPHNTSHPLHNKLWDGTNFIVGGTQYINGLYVIIPGGDRYMQHVTNGGTPAWIFTAEFS